VLNPDRLVVGLGLATGFTVLLASIGLLFGVSPTVPTVFLGTASLLFCSALSSMLFPTLRAIRIDLAVALRYE